MKYLLSIFAEFLGIEGEPTKKDRIILIIAIIFIILMIYLIIEFT